MKTIRNLVFETNSSSMHSITFGKDNAEASVSKLTISASGNYDWGYDEYDDPESLLDYAAVMMTEYVSNSNEQRCLVHNVIEYFKMRGVTVIDAMNYGHTCGYIDHQSIDKAIYEVFAHPDRLFDFVFGGSSLIIDNDNH